MANFLVKFPIFRYHGWQHGSCEQSLTDTIKLAFPEKPLVGARIWGNKGICPSQMSVA